MAKRHRIKGSTRFVTIVIALAIAAVAYFLNPGGIFTASEAEYTDSIKGKLSVHFIDIGQGDCIYVSAPTGENMLIDAGVPGVENDIINYLTSYGVSKLDYFLITHPHADHIGAASAIMDKFPIDKVLMTDYIATSKIYNDMLQTIDNLNLNNIFVEVGQKYSLGDAEIQILGPALEADDNNNSSIICRIVYGETAFLFSGDAEEKAIAAALKTSPASAFDSDVYKVGHHGSQNATTEAFLQAISPDIAVICCAEINDYGHPHKETIDLLAKYNITVLRTSTDGDVVITSDKEKVSILNG